MTAWPQSLTEDVNQFTFSKCDPDQTNHTEGAGRG